MVETKPYLRAHSPLSLMLIESTPRTIPRSNGGNSKVNDIEKHNSFRRSYNHRSVFLWMQCFHPDQKAPLSPSATKKLQDTLHPTVEPIPSTLHLRKKLHLNVFVWVVSLRMRIALPPENLMSTSIPYRLFFSPRASCRFSMRKAKATKADKQSTTVAQHEQ